MQVPLPTIPTILTAVFKLPSNTGHEPGEHSTHIQWNWLSSMVTPRYMTVLFHGTGLPKNVISYSGRNVVCLSLVQSDFCSLMQVWCLLSPVDSWRDRCAKRAATYSGIVCEVGQDGMLVFWHWTVCYVDVKVQRW